MIDNAVALVNGKGGVGKTSIVANVAVMAALAGWRVLAVDLDKQGNLARDLGYGAHTTDGKSLLEAVSGGGGTPRPLQGVRARLDVIDAGRHTKELEELLTRQALSDTAHYDLEGALAPVSGDYDLVLVDCPPAGGAIGWSALTLAHYAVIPTRVDDASIDGLAGLADDIADVRQSGANPDLYVLGVVLFAVGAGHRRIERETRRELDELLDGVAAVFHTTVRQSERSARDMRRRGEVAAEYERAALAAAPWYAASEDGEVREHFSSAAEGLAGDYQQLTNEILTHVLEHAQA